MGCALVTSLCVVGFAPISTAQENQEGPTEAEIEAAIQRSFEEEITVTGSMIPRPTLEAMSPVSVVEAEEISYSGVTRLEDLVTQLPQVFQAQNSTIANGASGTATVALRNLGAVRTLVLINGRRTAPGDAFSIAPDINFIPASLVKRVDILTGGASTTYGADAVTGVVNFVLDTDFEGVRGEFSYTTFQHNNSNTQAQQMNEDAGFPYPTGSTFDGDQMNISLALGSKFADGRGHASMYIDYRNVEALTKSERDYTNCSPGRGTNGPVCSGSSTTPRGRFIAFDQDYSQTGDYVLTLAEEGGDGHSFRDRTGEVFNYGPFNHMQRPDKRWTAGGFANYEVNQYADVYLEIMFMDDYSEAQIAPTGNFGRTTIINCDNPMLSQQQLDLVCGPGSVGDDGYANVTILRRNIEGGNRTSILRHTSWRLVAGIRGDLNDYWSYDLYGLYAEVANPRSYINDMHEDRIAEALDVIGDPNDPSTWVCRSGNPDCSPWNIFQEGGVTQDAIDFLSVNAVLQSGVKTQMLNGTLTGDLEGWGWVIPSASEGIQVATGVEYREESLYVNPDEVYELGLRAGSGGETVPIDDKYDVTEFFIEGLIPVVQDAPAFQDLSLELGYRYSDYNTSGGHPSWKAQVAYAPTGSFKFRSGYNRATRAPNVRELFAPQAMGLGGSEDICANDPATGVPSATQEQCARTGVSAEMYGTILANPAGQYNTLGGGNPDLQPEVADTLTVGIVFTPESVPGLSLALDYYDIQIEETIGNLNADDIIRTCANTGDPTLCSLIHRDQAGTLWLTDDARTVTTNQNIGARYAEGVDLSFSWLVGLGDAGYLNTSLIGTYMLARRLANPLIDYDCVGYYGNQCNIPTSEWRHRARFSWETNFNWVFTLGWRYVGSVLIDDASPDPDLRNEALIEEWRINGAYENPTFNYFDLAATASFAKHYQFIFGVNNVLDEEPPLGPDLNPNDYGPGWYGYYDPWGRTIHASLKFQF
jgi:outer membrane receptor protein involved in Fe transport